MNLVLKFDYTRASIMFYHVVALNTKHKSKNTINRKEAAHVLAELLQIHHRSSEAWMRGDFRRHPISRENFLRFVRIYRTKPGLENAQVIAALAVDLYGANYKKALELLDPADRDSDPALDVLVRLRGTSDVTLTINNLLASNSPEAAEIAFITMTAYQWFSHDSRHDH